MLGCAHKQLSSQRRLALGAHYLHVSCLTSYVRAHALMLCGMAGAEALFADLGHFNRHAMQLSTLAMVHTPL